MLENFVVVFIFSILYQLYQVHIIAVTVRRMGINMNTI